MTECELFWFGGKCYSEELEGNWYQKDIDKDIDIKYKSNINWFQKDIDRLTHGCLWLIVDDHTAADGWELIDKFDVLNFMSDVSTVWWLVLGTTTAAAAAATAAAAAAAAASDAS